MLPDGRTLKVKEDCIIMMLGTRFNSYCTTVGRCFFVDAPPKAKDEYNALSSAEDVAIRAESPLDVQEAIVPSLIKSNMDHLAENLHKSIGYLMEIKLSDFLYDLTDKNERIIKPRMMFHISFSDESSWEDEEKNEVQSHALFLMDTVASRI